MILQEFLELIQDEEAKIELEIDWGEGTGAEYQYHHFWLSDFRTNNDIAKYYRWFNVISFSFVSEQEKNAQIRIRL